jgi:hemerythrin-like domain-containing protein
MSLERLVLEHDAIDMISRDLCVVSRQVQPNHEAAVALLSQLAHEVEAHLEYEDRTVYSVLIERYKAPSRVGAEKFEQLFNELSSDWRSYLAEWTDQKIRADWVAFGVATTEMMLKVRARVMAETNLIYSLALSDGIIRLRDAD